MDTKTCNSCKNEKSLDDFHFENRVEKKRKNTCKECQALYFKKYKERNQEKLRKSWRQASKKYYTPENARRKHLSRYGLDTEGYDKLYDEQGGGCAICHQAIVLVVDHCHNSLKVRGLLCNGCNLAIGYFEDDVERMKSAIKYLNTAG